MFLNKQPLSGFIWTFSDTFLVMGIMFVAMIFLTRWIWLSDFGLMGMIAIIVAFQFGVMGLVWSSVFNYFVGLGVNMFYSSKLIDCLIYKQISDLGVTFFLAFIIAMSMLGITLVLVDTVMILQIIIASLVGCLVYMGMNYCVNNSPLHEAV